MRRQLLVEAGGVFLFVLRHKINSLPVPPFFIEIIRLFTGYTGNQHIGYNGYRLIPVRGNEFVKKYDYHDLVSDIETGEIEKASPEILRKYLSILCKDASREARPENVIMGFAILNEQNRRTQKIFMGIAVLSMILAFASLVFTITIYRTSAPSANKTQQTIIEQEYPMPKAKVQAMPVSVSSEKSTVAAPLTKQSTRTEQTSVLCE